jgi:outer membrane protein insertion porin family
VEYRFPITFLTVFDQGVDLGGTLFVDYGDLLGTQDEVMGEPGLVRDKPGEGLGFGIGLRADTEFAIGRFELGISDRGDVEFYFTLGDRF